MRIAVSADSKEGLDSVVSFHFGRRPYFVLVDVEGREVTQVAEIDNPFYGSHRPGEVPGFIHQQAADVMLAGGMGARAMHFFAQFGIEPVTGATGTVRLALERYLGGELKGAAPCAPSQDHGHLPPEGAFEKDELARLKEEIKALQNQADDAMGRLNRMRGEG